MASLATRRPAGRSHANAARCHVSCDLPRVAPLAIAYAVVTGRAWPSYLGPARPAPTAPALPSGPVTASADAHAAPEPPGKEFATLTSTLRPSGRCRRLRYAPASSHPERLRSYLQGRPDPGPLHQASSRAVLATLRTARLQARRIHPSRPRCAAHIERRRSRQLKRQSAPPLHVLRFASGVRYAHVSSAHPPQAAPGAQAVPVGRFFASYEPAACHSLCSPEAGRFRSSTALRAVPDRPLPEQKVSLCVRSQARTLPRPYGAGLAVRWLLSPRGIVA